MSPAAAAPGSAALLKELRGDVLVDRTDGFSGLDDVWFRLGGRVMVTNRGGAAPLAMATPSGGALGLPVFELASDSDETPASP